MHRSLFAPLMVFVLAVAVLFSGGCGGGGGGSSSSGGDSGSTTGSRPSGAIFTQYIVGTASGSSTSRSVANMEVGDVINLRSLALYVGVGGYTGGFYEDLTNIVVDAPGVATLDGTTLTAIGVGSGTITATGANGVPLAVTLTVSSNLASVTGRVRTVQIGSTNAGVATVLVHFLNSAGDEVATVLTGPDGRFQANVPLTATRFVADFGALPNSFYNQFTFETLDYSGDVNGCSAPLPALSLSSSAATSDSIGYRKGGSNPPPPPPSGCGG